VLGLGSTPDKINHAILLFTQGLDGLLPLKPPLAMAQEFSRETAWTDWKGAR